MPPASPPPSQPSLPPPSLPRPPSPATSGRGAPRAGSHAGRRHDARGRAIDVLVAVDDGAHSQAALSVALDAAPPLPDLDRGLLTGLVYGSLRWSRLLDGWAAAASARGLEGVDPATHAALRIGLYQLAALERVPTFAAISATMDAAAGRAPRPRLPYLHAVLQRAAREQPWAAGVDPAAAQHPWQAEALRAFAAACDVEPTALLAAMLQPAPVHVHVIPAARETAAAAFAADGVEVARVAGLAGVYEVTHGAFHRSRLALARTAIAQDAGSAMVTAWLNVQPGERVADVCAGRGAKALFLAAAGGRVDAFDADARRLAEAVALAQAAGWPLQSATAADATAALPATPGSYDAVLVDAPCSGLGTLRRRPEIADRRTMADVVRLARLQRQILTRAAALVRPGGRLVYSVCTITAAEGADVVDGFLREHPEFVREPAEFPDLVSALDHRGDLRSHPLLGGADCFFAARLVRRPS